MNTVRAESTHPANGPTETGRPPDELRQRLLIARLRAGDRSALDEIAAEHCPRLARLVSRMTGWSSDSDDLVQEVFVSVIRSARRYRGESQLSTWLTSIALNVCRLHHRKKVVRAALWRGVKFLKPTSTSQDASHLPQENDRAQAVTNAVAKLASRYREVVVLHYLEEMTHDEAAEALGISIGAVRVRLNRARSELRKALGPLMDLEK